MGLSARAQFAPRGDLGRFVAARVTPGVVASVTAACTMIQQAAQGYCPVDTGALRESIAVSVEESGSTVVGKVSTDVEYAAYVEYGTGMRGMESAGAGEGPYNPNWPGMPAQPYMRPALDEARGAIKEIFASNISLGGL